MTQYKTHYTFENGNSIISTEQGIYMMIDSQGMNILGDIFSNITPIWDYKNGNSKDFFLITNIDSHKMGLVDTFGNIIIPPKFSHISISTHMKGLFIVTDGSRMTYVYQGIISDKWFNRIDDFIDGYASVRDGYNKWGLINLRGEEIIPCKYKMLSTPSDAGLIAAEIDNRYGYININDKTIIPFIFEIAHPFSDGYAKVKFPNDPIWKIINIWGEVVADLGDWKNSIPGTIYLNKLKTSEIRPISISQSIQQFTDFRSEKERIASFKGKSIIVNQEFEIGYLEHYYAPFTGCSSIKVKPGVIFSDLHSMRDDAFYGRCEEKEMYKIAIENTEKCIQEALKGRLQGISFFVTVEQLDKYCSII